MLPYPFTWHTSNSSRHPSESTAECVWDVRVQKAPNVTMLNQKWWNCHIRIINLHGTSCRQIPNLKLCLNHTRLFQILNSSKGCAKVWYVRVSPLSLILHWSVSGVQKGCYLIIWHEIGGPELENSGKHSGGSLSAFFTSETNVTPQSQYSSFGCGGVWSARLARLRRSV